MTALYAIIKDKLNNRSSRQALLLLTANMLSLPVGLILNVILARNLDVAGYGNYTFINSIFLFAAVIFNFGFFHAGNRAIVLSSDMQQRKRYYGALLVYLLGLYVVMSVSLALYGFLDPNMKAKGVVCLFLCVLPGSIIFLLAKFFEVILQADNRIGDLATVSLLPKLLYLISVCIWFFLFDNVFQNNLLVVWILHIITSLIVYSAVLVKISPSFRDLFPKIADIWQYNRSYGIHLYIGAVFALGMNSLTTILVSYFSSSNERVAFYSLAVMFSIPLSMIPNTIATSYYRQFACREFIPAKLFWITLFISLMGLLLQLCCVPFVIKHFFGTAYAVTIKLNVITAVSYIFYGFGDFFNRFHGAHGHGKVLRNGALLTALILCICNVVFIPEYSVYGAAWSLFCTAVFYFFFMIFSYYRFQIHND